MFPNSPKFYINIIDIAMKMRRLVVYTRKTHLNHVEDNESRDTAPAKKTKRKLRSITKKHAVLIGALTDPLQALLPQHANIVQNGITIIQKQAQRLIQPPSSISPTYEWNKPTRETKQYHKININIYLIRSSTEYCYSCHLH